MGRARLSSSRTPQRPVPQARGTRGGGHGRLLQRAVSTRRTRRQCNGTTTIDGLHRTGNRKERPKNNERKEDDERSCEIWYRYSGRSGSALRNRQTRRGSLRRTGDV